MNERVYLDMQMSQEILSSASVVRSAKSLVETDTQIKLRKRLTLTCMRGQGDFRLQDAFVAPFNLIARKRTNQLSHAIYVL